MRQMNRLVLRLAVQALKKKTNSQSPQLVWKPQQDFVTKRCSKWKLVNLKNKWTTATEPAEFNATKVHEAPSHEEDCNDGCNPITVKRWWPFTHGTSTVPTLVLPPKKKNHCHSCSLKSKDLPCESDLSKFRHFDRSQTGKSGLDLKSGNLSLQAMKQWWKPSQAVGSTKRTDVQPSNSSSFLIFLLQAIDVDVQMKLQKHCLTSGHQQTRFITHGRRHDWNHSQGGRMSSCPLFLQLSSNKNFWWSPNLSQTSFQFKVFTDDTLCIQQNLSDQKFQDHLTIAT